MLWEYLCYMGAQKMKKMGKQRRLNSMVSRQNIRVLLSIDR